MWLVAVLALQPPPLTRRAILSEVTGVQQPPLTRRAILSGVAGAVSLGGVRRVLADDRWVPAGDPAKADSYIVQLKAGEKAMVDLLANWEAATKAAVQNAEGDAIDGDAVRRVVGSVGTSSPLFGVDKVLKIVGSDLDANGKVDFIDFTELSDEVVVKLRETNDMAYSAIFSDASGNYGRPGQGSKDYLERSRVALTAALASYRRLLALIPG